MLATIALGAALLTIAIGGYRLTRMRGAELSRLQLAAARGGLRLMRTAVPALSRLHLSVSLLAGALGIAAWWMSDDTRCLVGGLLMVGAAVLGQVAGQRRGAAITAPILSLLAAALFALAHAQPKIDFIAVDRVVTTENNSINGATTGFDPVANIPASHNSLLVPAAA